jgi:BAH domain/C-5 cytosine-specific DNA methylase
MKELAGPQELFLLTQCDDNPLSSIACKIQVEYLGGNHSVEDGSLVEQKFLNNNHYFYRLHWHPVNEQFTDAAIYEVGDSKNCGAHHCGCCTTLQRKLLKDQTKIFGSIPDNGLNRHFEGFSRGGIDYLLNDFVYIFSDPEVPYQVGQIQKISLAGDGYTLSPKSRTNEKLLKIKVDLYKRYDRFHKSYFEEFQDRQQHAIRDERRLYKSVKTKRIWADQIDGKCHVRHRQHIDDLDKYKDDKDCFWVADEVPPDMDPRGEIRQRDLMPLSPKELKYSAFNDNHLAVERKRVEDFQRKGGKLRGLDIFAGAGGLSKGLSLSGSVDTRWAIERDQAACQTYKKNFPKAKVFCADANILLDRALRRENGDKLEPLYDCHGELLPELPRKGEVDFIYGGKYPILSSTIYYASLY